MKNIMVSILKIFGLVMFAVFAIVAVVSLCVYGGAILFNYELPELFYRVASGVMIISLPLGCVGVYSSEYLEYT